MRRTMMIAALSVCVVLGMAACATTPQKAMRSHTGFLTKQSPAVDGRTHKYVVYVPEDYTPEKAWPLVVFLHGWGERGSDGTKQMIVGIGPAIMRWPERFPCIVLMPQCPESVTPQKGEDLLAAVVRQVREWFPIIDAEYDATLQQYNIDKSRVYLTGLSMGAFASWRYEPLHPDRFAAMMPICGAGDVKDAPVLAKIPIWDFHGASDSIVNVKYSQEMVEAVRAAGGDIKYTEYPGVDHNSWDRAYSDPESMKWLLSHQKK